MVPPNRVQFSLSVVCLVAFSWLAGNPQSSAQAAAPKKFALLVGINKYAHADLNKPSPLQYAEADMTALQTILEASGYKVVVLTGDKAKLANIRSALAALRKNGTGAAVVLTAFAGHGLQPEESKEAYFCPYDAKQAVSEREGKKVADWDLQDNMLPLSELLQELRACGAESKALLVDAARNHPKTGLGQGFGAGYKVGDLPENTALMLSCSKGERAWEDKTWGHGVFFHHVLKGIGEGKGAIDGHVTAKSLIAYVNRAVRTDVPTVIGGGSLQRPHAIISGDVDLFITSIAPVATRPLLANSLKNSLGMELQLIPAGEFLMGSPEGEAEREVNEFPQHRVRITRPFYMGKHEVTKGQFAAFVAEAKYTTDGERDGTGGYGVDDEGQGSEKPEFTWRNPGFAQTDDHPVVNVSWNDAIAFCEWLSKKEGKTYRLPTEAEWEYACRAGTTTTYQHGHDPEGLATVGNMADGTAKAKFPSWEGTISARDGYVFSAPVGQYRKNNFGLYDLHGNVWEWCQDMYDQEAYSERGTVTENPLVTKEGLFRVYRGGCWGNSAESCRSAYRGWNWSSSQMHLVGFRLVLSPSGE